ncbi:hypothetical protein [Mycobacterium marinum]|uniref:hypothetical protein n=1 Tax=Mycobacterium marinum TaxID=1781 RepID=UPI0021C45BD5|nr:hypothetical protein [Mycobacterium marinum]GJP20537.1 hypothetical protein NJB1808e29_03450 [Mycobacterium marinum]GJP26694.1 hypothetical protein NJB1808_45430 [Mycobacterium marinum]
MVDLPRNEQPFGGVINPVVADSTPVTPSIDYPPDGAPNPPDGAPNVVVVLLDDVGFGARVPALLTCRLVTCADDSW